MRQKILSLICILFLSKGIVYAQTAPTGLWTDYTVPFSLEYPDKENSMENPYLIDSPEKLAFMALKVNEKEEHFRTAFYKLTKDIDLSAHYWVPISKFMGYFDGNKKVISHLIIDGNKVDDTCLGLFGDLKNNASLLDIILRNVNVKGRLLSDLDPGKPYPFCTTAALVGFSIAEEETPASIIRCHVQGGVIQGGDGEISVTGGLVGELSDHWVLTDCSNSAHITGGKGLKINSYTGGIVGRAWGHGIISGCTNSGIVTGGEALGFIVYSDTIRASNGSIVGGIAGLVQTLSVEISTHKNRRTIGKNLVFDRCENYGEVKGPIVTEAYNHKESSYTVGGILGFGGAYKGKFFTDTLTVTNSCNKGTVVAATKEKAKGKPLRSYTGDLFGRHTTNEQGVIKLEE